MVMASDGQNNAVFECDGLLHKDGRAEIVIAWAVNAETGEETVRQSEMTSVAMLKRAQGQEYILKTPLQVKSVEEFRRALRRV
jgi:hypothetical protein